MKILVLQEADWLERGPHQHHHLMERLSVCGYEIRAIDYEFLWRKNQKKELISKRETYANVHKAINDGSVTVIRPSIIKLPVLEYLSLITTHGWEIKKQIEDFRPHVVVGFSILSSNIALRFAKRRGIPFVYYVIDECHRLVPQRYFQWLARYIEGKNMRGADKVISINEALREYTVQMGAHQENTEVISAGVDVELFGRADGTSIRKKYHILDDDIVVFFSGLLLDFMGLKEVVSELANSNRPNIKLLILGKGDLRDMLQNIGRESGLADKIIIVDWVPYSEVPNYVAASDICILPAYNNNIMRNIVPIKLYDYMAAGKPVISTNLYGVSKEFGVGNGVSYSKRPHDVLKMVFEMVDEGNIEEEGKKSKRFIQNYTWDNKVKQFEQVLENLIQRK